MPPLPLLDSQWVAALETEIALSQLWLEKDPQSSNPHTQESSCTRGNLIMLFCLFKALQLAVAHSDSDTPLQSF